MIPIWSRDSIPGYETASPSHIPILKPFILQKKQPNACVIVFPGGGYTVKAPHEADPVAKWLNRIGLSSFVLDYRVQPYMHPYPMLDGLRAVRYVRANADKFNLHPDKIGVLGFSAGGHLAATVGTHHDNGNHEDTDPIERESSRPDALVLCYPVISFLQNFHQGSIHVLIGSNPPDELRFSLSAEKQVNTQTPQTFIWHTANDEGVPVENSLAFSSALSKHKVPFDLHIFSDGPHGVGLAESDPILSSWTKLCELWFRKIGFLPL